MQILRMNESGQSREYFPVRLRPLSPKNASRLLPACGLLECNVQDVAADPRACKHRVHLRSRFHDQQHALRTTKFAATFAVRDPSRRFPLESESLRPVN